jgi:hypothetical protein
MAGGATRKTTENQRAASIGLPIPTARFAQLVQSAVIAFNRAVSRYKHKKSQADVAPRCHTGLAEVEVPAEDNGVTYI